jgi:hypothetical protein
MDNACTLYPRIIKVAIAQLRDFVPRLEGGSIQSQPQDDHQANVW